MGSLSFALLFVIVIGFICIRITLKSSVEPAEPAAQWECETCGMSSPSSDINCSQCGMERPA